ncbi:MAG: hypothetical protein HPY72_10445 [Anaerolineae bacterium]|nr:hypothetical protein [Anaerolineae bacterium]
MKCRRSVQFKLNSIRYFYFGFFLFFSLLVITREAQAQDAIPPGVTPQKVTAVIEVDETRTDTGELVSSIDGVLEFWNVGAMGGEAYKTAIVTLNFYFFKEGSSSAIFEFIFSGGPEGTFTLVSGPNYTSGPAGSRSSDIMGDLNQVWIPNELETTQQDCTVASSVLSGLSNTYWYRTESSEPFSGWFPSCSTCTAAMTWDANLQAGDVLSPETSYTGPDGQPIEPLGQALYINGKETWSVVWDGQPASLELQYTCPDHAAHVLNLTVPAANMPQPKDQNPPQSPPQASLPQPDSQKSTPGTSLKDLIKIILVGVGVISIGTSAIVIGKKLISGSAKPKTGIERDISTDSRKSFSKESGGESKPIKQERAELREKAIKLDAKWNEIKREINKRENQLLKLIRKNTTNRLKVLVKKAIEVREVISGPVGKFVGEGFKGATGVDIDKMLFDLDNKKDVDILVQGKECQAALKNYIDSLKQDLLKTGREHTRVLNQLKELEK